MVDQRIPRDRIRCKMTPDTYKLLKEAAGITRFVEADTGVRNIDRNVGKLDGVTIMEVPKDMMMSAYDFTDGWAGCCWRQAGQYAHVRPAGHCGPGGV